MHEVSLVADLLDECVRRAAGRRVAVVRVRHANTIPDDVLEQAFALLTGEGALAGARLEREEFALTYTCGSCSFHGVLEHEHLIGHIVVCPSCSEITTSGHAAELELLGVDLGPDLPE